MAVRQPAHLRRSARKSELCRRRLVEGVTVECDGPPNSVAGKVQRTGRVPRGTRHCYARLSRPECKSDRAPGDTLNPVLEESGKEHNPLRGIAGPTELDGGLFFPDRKRPFSSAGDQPPTLVRDYLQTTKLRILGAFRRSALRTPQQRARPRPLRCAAMRRAVGPSRLTGAQGRTRKPRSGSP